MIESVWDSKKTADWLGITMPTLYRVLAGDDAPPGRVVGGHWVFSVRALTQWAGSDPDSPLRAGGPPRMMTVEDVAAELGVSKRSVYGLVRSEGLPSKRVGRRWMVNEDALHRWLARE